MLLNELYNRRNKLEEYLGICRRKLRNAPEGWLRTSLCRGHATYYMKKSKDDYRGTYLPYEENKVLIRRLAEKEYYGKMEEEITRELKAINHLIEIERKERLSVVYCRMNPIKQSLVVPLEDSIENEIKRWKGVKYPVMEPKPGSYVIKTKRGEFVRSKAEYNIANSLYEAKVPYKYEPVVMTVDGNYERPDFEIKSPVTGEVLFWEHFGMLDKPDYVDRMMTKLESYEMSDIYPGNGLIITFDDGRHGLDIFHIKRIIKRLLKAA